MQLWDGEQKMSDWPAEIKDAIFESEIYRKNIAYSQSKYSKNEILPTRLEGKKWFVSYNKILKVFFVWYIEKNLENCEYDARVVLKIPKRVLNEIENKGHINEEKYIVPIKINENDVRLCDIYAIDESRFLKFFKDNL